MIQLLEVSKEFPLAKEHTVHAVREVSLRIDAGEFVLIVGRSGCGKTTLLNLAAGLTRPSAGRVLLDGDDLWQMSDEQQSLLRSQKIGFVFQFPSLLPTLTVFENLLLPAMFAGKPANVKQASAETTARAGELLEQVGLSAKRDAYPRQLSAGQQQRVVIARALVNHPRLLLADEPTSNLDEKTELEIMDLFRGLHASLGLTIVMVTHTRQLLSLGMRSVEMAEGRVVRN